MKITQNIYFKIFSGWVILILVWFLVSSLQLINTHVLPTPAKVMSSFVELWSEDNLAGNLLFSLRLNFTSYVLSIAGSLIVGFGFGLNPYVRQMFNSQINSLRFVPITATMGIFIAMSGITFTTKILFLSFGIWVYLVPVVVQRIDEVSKTHLQMMKTLNATPLQTFKHVQWKSVISKLSDDIRILVGISWTYIIVAELTGMQGGVGTLIFLGEKQSNIGKVYCVIAVIIVIGLLQDMLFKYIDKLLFKFKY